MKNTEVYILDDMSIKNTINTVALVLVRSHLKFCLQNMTRCQEMLLLLKSIFTLLLSHGGTASKNFIWIHNTNTFWLKFHKRGLTLLEWKVLCYILWPKPEILYKEIKFVFRKREYLTYTNIQKLRKLLICKIAILWNKCDIIQKDKAMGENSF